MVLPGASPGPGADCLVMGTGSNPYRVLKDAAAALAEATGAATHQWRRRCRPGYLLRAAVRPTRASHVSAPSLILRRRCFPSPLQISTQMNLLLFLPDPGVDDTTT